MRTHALWAIGSLWVVCFTGIAADPVAAQLAEAGLSELEPSHEAAPASEKAALPFAPGERLEYAITIARLRLGHGVLAVEAAELLDGVPTYRLALEVDIKAPFLSFADREVSWVATDPIRSMVFERQRVESGREERRRFHFDHVELRYNSEVWDARLAEYRPATGEDAAGEIPAGAIDEIAALYLLRTLSLESNTTHRIARYFVPTANPIVFRVVGRERVKVPAGRFEVVVVEPDIPALGPFQASKQPRIYITDDARRLIVKITTRTKAGPLTFYLKDFSVGS